MQDSEKKAPVAKGKTQGACETERPNCDAKDAIGQVISCLFEPGDVVELRRLHDGGNLRKLPPQITFAAAAKLSEYADKLTDENTDGYHVFFGANPRKPTGGGSAKDVALVRCLFGDFDGIDLTEATHRREQCSLPAPTLTVLSGHGVHMWWRLSEPLTDLSQTKRLQQNLAAMLGSDSAVCDAPRLMRMPGFVNHKKPPMPCVLVDAEPERVYDGCEFKDVWDFKPPAPETNGRAETNGRVHEGGRNTFLTSEAGRMRKSSHTTEAAILAALLVLNREKCDPPLTESDVSKIAKSIGNKKADAAPFKPRPKMVCMADVVPRDVTYLWLNRYPLRMLSMLYGDGGLGKSWVTHDMAARVSTGRAWPDAIGSDREPADVVMLNAEDPLSEVIAPRLISSCADLKRIHILTGIQTGEDTDRMANLKDDMDMLRQAVGDTKAKMVVVDPVGGYLGGKDSFKDSEVREVLSPLVMLAEEFDAAVVMVAHTRKAITTKAAHMVMGSAAFTNITRASWTVLPDPDNPGARIMTCAKANVLQAPTGLRFRIEDGELRWDADAVLTSADDILANLARKVTGKSPKQHETWLIETLRDNGGKMLVRDIERLCDGNVENDIEPRSFQGVCGAKARLKDQIGHRNLGNNGSEWYLKAG